MFLRFLILGCFYGFSLSAQDIFEPGDFQFDPTHAVWVRLPEGVSFEPDYPPDSLGFHKSVLIDLDGDGISENLWVNLCGTGGCVYTIQRGKDRKYIGEFFGDPVIVREQKINDMPVINSYSHGSAASGDYFCYVFNGEEYVMVSKIHLLKESVENLFKKLKDIPWLQK
jgi:hypothetical protein